MRKVEHRQKENREVMIDSIINHDKTIAGDGKDVILAGRYHILR